MDNLENKSSGGMTSIIVGIVVLLCCLCLLAAGIGGYAYYTFMQSGSTGPIEVFGDPISPDNNPTQPTEPTELIRPSVDSISSETVDTLENAIVPENDPRVLACRLDGKCGVPEVMATSASPRSVGEQQNFWVHDLDTNENNEVQATLRYITPHVYFWVQDGLDIDEGEMKKLVDTFENQMYPTNREFFGSEWSPGIDGDEHIYILYSRGLGFSVAGYFSSSDSTHPMIQEYSNAHEMFLFNADNTPLGGDYAYAVLAHEFQHMIHWNNDLNETSWLNEGSSELAVLLNGYETGGFDTL
ncbi:MAG TPA: hypothetical protein PKJ84_04480, partial [Anaerolineales bacterium]|nr:hypothetical protein [Anaerolineales bacterium]